MKETNKQKSFSVNVYFKAFLSSFFHIFYQASAPLYREGVTDTCGDIFIQMTQQAFSADFKGVRAQLASTMTSSKSSQKLWLTDF